MMVKERITSSGRNAQIDFVRFLLCLIIMLFHYLYKYSEIYNLNHTYFINDVTFVVAIFFVISGFFASYSTFTATAKSKMINLYFPFVLSVLFIFGILITTKHAGGLNFVDLAGNILIFPLLANKAAYIDGAHWYLIVLLLFFAIFILINVSASLFKSKKGIVVDILMGMLFATSFVVNLFDSDYLVMRLLRTIFNAYFIFICFGFFLRKILLESNVTFIVICSIMFACLCVFFINKGNRSGLVLFVIFLFIFYLACKNKLPSCLNSFPSFLGQSSFFIYLIHQQIGYTIINIFDAHLNLYFVGVICSIVLSASIGIGFHFGWNQIKKRLNNYGRK